MIRRKGRAQWPVWGSGGAVLLALAVLGLGAAGAAGAPFAWSAGNAARAGRPGPVLTPTQDFQDVPTSSPFYSYLHNLGGAGVVGGYGCGGPDEPCVPPDNLPYYRPGNAVTRLQMTKFIDLGRRNIADAVGNSLDISTTAHIGLYAGTQSGGEAIFGECLQAGVNCYAVEGAATSGNYSGYFTGGTGLYTTSQDSGQAGVYASANSPNSLGGEFSSPLYRSAQVDAPPVNNGYIPLAVDGSGLNLAAEHIFSGGLNVDGNLVVAGSKSGYVVDVMQNADSSPLEPGDVVVMVGSRAPVLGQIPVIVVKKAATAYDTALAGVVDQALYVPDAATKAAYDSQQAALRAAQAARDGAIRDAQARGTKPDLSKLAMPALTITDEQGGLHATDASSIAAGGYANVVTLGAYKAIKVDAGFGAIHVGDLLTTSGHAGYAMKATDRAAALGAVIGKALADLPAGTGLIPVMVTLK